MTNEKAAPKYLLAAGKLNKATGERTIKINIAEHQNGTDKIANGQNVLIANYNPKN
jgi:hypothetical protein